LLYLKYFLYLGWNWNFKLACIITWHEIRGEKKYGVQTTGIDDLTSSVAANELDHASIYQPINYYVAEWLFNQIEPTDILEKRLLDAGCGRGRVLAMGAYFGFKHITGIDISPKLCHESIETVDRLVEKYPETHFEVLQEDACSYKIPDDTSTIFLFNPFDKVIMEPFVQHVLKSLERKPRKLKILYANPECRQVWEEAGFVKVAEVRKLKWLQGMVFTNMP
jgi:SAM-dependent methyltransferase